MNKKAEAKPQQTNLRSLIYCLFLRTYFAYLPCALLIAALVIADYLYNDEISNLFALYQDFYDPFADIIWIPYAPFDDYVERTGNNLLLSLLFNLAELVPRYFGLLGKIWFFLFKPIAILIQLALLSSLPILVGINLFLTHIKQEEHHAKVTAKRIQAAKAAKKRKLEKRRQKLERCIKKILPNSRETRIENQVATVKIERNFSVLRFLALNRRILSAKNVSQLVLDEGVVYEITKPLIEDYASFIPGKKEITTEYNTLVAHIKMRFASLTKKIYISRTERIQPIIRNNICYFYLELAKTHYEAFDTVPQSNAFITVTKEGIIAINLLKISNLISQDKIIRKITVFIRRLENLPELQQTKQQNKNQLNSLTQMAAITNSISSEFILDENSVHTSNDGTTTVELTAVDTALDNSLTRLEKQHGPDSAQRIAEHRLIYSRAETKNLFVEAKMAVLREHNEYVEGEISTQQELTGSNSGATYFVGRLSVDPTNCSAYKSINRYRPEACANVKHHFIRFDNNTLIWKAPYSNTVTILKIHPKKTRKSRQPSIEKEKGRIVRQIENKFPGSNFAYRKLNGASANSSKTTNEDLENALRKFGRQNARCLSATIQSMNERFSYRIMVDRKRKQHFFVDKTPKNFTPNIELGEDWRRITPQLKGVAAIKHFLQESEEDDITIRNDTITIKKHHSDYFSALGKLIRQNQQRLAQDLDKQYSEQLENLDDSLRLCSIWDTGFTIDRGKGGVNRFYITAFAHGATPHQLQRYAELVSEVYGDLLLNITHEMGNHDDNKVYFLLDISRFSNVELQDFKDKVGKYSLTNTTHRDQLRSRAADIKRELRKSKARAQVTNEDDTLDVGIDLRDFDSTPPSPTLSCGIPFDLEKGDIGDDIDISSEQDSTSETASATESSSEESSEEDLLDENSSKPTTTPRRRRAKRGRTKSPRKRNSIQKQIARLETKFTSTLISPDQIQISQLFIVSLILEVCEEMRRLLPYKSIQEEFRLVRNDIYHSFSLPKSPNKLQSITEAFFEDIKRIAHLCDRNPDITLSLKLPFSATALFRQQEVSKKELARNLLATLSSLVAGKNSGLPRTIMQTVLGMLGVLLKEIAPRYYRQHPLLAFALNSCRHKAGTIKRGTMIAITNTVMNANPFQETRSHFPLTVQDLKIVLRLITCSDYFPTYFGGNIIRLPNAIDIFAPTLTQTGRTRKYAKICKMVRKSTNLLSFCTIEGIPFICCSEESNSICYLFGTEETEQKTEAVRRFLEVFFMSNFMGDRLPEVRIITASTTHDIALHVSEVINRNIAPAAIAARYSGANPIVALQKIPACGHKILANFVTRKSQEENYNPAYRYTTDYTEAVLQQYLQEKVANGELVALNDSNATDPLFICHNHTNGTAKIILTQSITIFNLQKILPLVYDSICALPLYLETTAEQLIVPVEMVYYENMHYKHLRLECTLQLHIEEDEEELSDRATLAKVVLWVDDSFGSPTAPTRFLNAFSEATGHSKEAIETHSYPLQQQTDANKCGAFALMNLDNSISDRPRVNKQFSATETGELCMVHYDMLKSTSQEDLCREQEQNVGSNWVNEEDLLKTGANPKSLELEAAVFDVFWQKVHSYKEAKQQIMLYHIQEYAHAEANLHQGKELDQIKRANYHLFRDKFKKWAPAKFKQYFDPVAETLKDGIEETGFWRALLYVYYWFNTNNLPQLQKLNHHLTSNPDISFVGATNWGFSGSIFSDLRDRFSATITTLQTEESATRERAQF